MTVTHTMFGQLPAVTIAAPDGAEAIVTLYGAHLVSWRGAGGRQRLFCSASSALDGSRAIRGGVPVIFPQFGERGDGMRHGFARVANWRLADSGTIDGAAYADFALDAAALTDQQRASWPHAFALRLRVRVRAEELQLELDVHNTGKAPCSFSSALHSYFLVDALEQASVTGLQGVPFTDAAAPHAAPQAQQQAVLHVSGTVSDTVADTFDRIYFGLPQPLALGTGGETLRLEQDGFTDAVVWNPGARDAQALVDMQDDEYTRFLCVEAAVIAPRELASGARWLGRHRIAATHA